MRSCARIALEPFIPIVPSRAGSSSSRATRARRESAGGRPPATYRRVRSSPSSSVRRYALRNDEAERVQHALESCPSTTGTSLQLYYVSVCAIAIIAEALESRSDGQTYLSRAKRRLREELDTRDSNWPLSPSRGPSSRIGVRAHVERARHAIRERRMRRRRRCPHVVVAEAGRAQGGDLVVRSRRNPARDAGAEASIACQRASGRRFAS